jgi:hypothetical protein
LLVYLTNNTVPMPGSKMFSYTYFRIQATAINILMVNGY